MLGNVYEGLTKRDKDLKIIPGPGDKLGSWSNPPRWRFHLRQGVKFQNGDDFNADDVVFSADRARGPKAPTSRPAFPPTPRSSRSTTTPSTSCSPRPNPILNSEWDTWYMMAKKWAEANNAVTAQPRPASR